jgi:hypothetical protein
MSPSLIGQVSQPFDGKIKQLEIATQARTKPTEINETKSSICKGDYEWVRA